MIIRNWQHIKAKTYFLKAVQLFGAPVFVADVQGGMAYWKVKGLFSEHVLRDQAVRHCVPAKHYDFFYSSIKCYVPPEKRLAVLSISGSINYDGLTKMLTARCASLEANVATLFLGMSVANGEMDIRKVKKAGLYARYIRGEIETHTKLKQLMLRQKRANNHKYKKQIAQPFDPLAFAKC